MQKASRGFMPVAAIVLVALLYAYGTLSAPYIPAGIESIVLPLDLMVGLPAIFYFCIVRAKGLTPLSVIPAIWLGYGLSTLALGSPDAGILPLLLALLAPVELAIAACEARKITSTYRAAKRASDDPIYWMRATVESVVAKEPVSSVATTELSVWHYLLFSWRRKPLMSPDERAFTTYRDGGYMSLMCGLGLAFPVELVGMHMLVMQWSPVAAVVVTLLSIYMVAWLAGDARARVMRPVAVGPRGVRVECGIQCSAAIPIGSINSVRMGGNGGAPQGSDVVNMGTFYHANVWLTADEPFAVRTPFGEKRVRTIGFTVDDAAGFVSAVEGCLVELCRK